MTELIYPELSYQVQGAFFDIFNPLRHLELSESGWETALLIALEGRGIGAQRQVEYELRYKGYRIGRFFVDVVADDKIALELKVQEALHPVDFAQLLTYLKVTGLKLGMLVNFGGKELEFKRIPNFVGQRTASPVRATTDHQPANLLYPELTAALRDILYTVHAELGPGFMPMHYRRAVQIELRLNEIPYEKRNEITISFRGQPIETRDARFLIVDERVLLVPTALREITPAITGRLRQYLRLLHLQLGLIANFHAPSLVIETIRV